MLSKKSIDILEELAHRYAKFGVTFSMLRDMLVSRPEEVSEELGIVGIKFALSEEYGICEWESFDTACAILDITPEELMQKCHDANATVITDVKFDTSVL